MTAQVFGLSQKEAAERLRLDFHLDKSTTSRPDPETAAKAKQRKDEREQINARWAFLADVVREADAELARYEPERAWDSARFVAVLRAKARAETELDNIALEDCRRHDGKQTS